MTETEPYYGEAPVDLGPMPIDDWHEFMHYLYLPVRIPAHDDPAVGFRAPEARFGQEALPERLNFLRPAIWLAAHDARNTTPHLTDPYIYVTARRGHVTPGNPGNRPGWHCDDFGGTDLNYIWTDRWPTRFLCSDRPLTLPDDDLDSMDVMETLATSAAMETERWQQARIFNGNAPRPALWIEHGEREHLLRLSPYVVHDTPLVPAPGGMRSFYKISVSSHRYNLLGNSHNYDLDYDWPMHDRAVVRNQPGGQGDYVRDPA